MTTTLIKKITVIKLLLLGIVAPASAQTEENAWTDYIHLYQRLGSRHVGGNCRLVPSCSNYGMLQFKSNSVFIAFLNTSDRLLRCSHDLGNYYITMTEDSYRLIDYPSKQEDELAKPKWAETNYASIDSIQLIQNPATLITYLMNQGHYSEALLEINREIFETQNKTSSEDLYVNYIRCLRSLGRFDRINLDYQTIIPDIYRNSPKILLEMTRVWMALSNDTQANESIKQILKQPGLQNQNIQDEAKILASMNYAKTFKWQEAQKILQEISITSPYAPNAKKNLTNAQMGIDFTPKKPWIAGVLSIIPGAGYLYAKHPSSAFSSLVFNGLLAFASYSSFQSGNTGMGILSSVIGLGFYAGNIQGSVKSVKRYNLVNQERIANQLTLQFSF